jgi:hypothetical protein
LTYEGNNMSNSRAHGLKVLLAFAFAFASESAYAGIAQTINFPNPGTQLLYGTAPILAATASSGLPVTYVSGSTSICTITTSGALTFLIAGNCKITAKQAGGGGYDKAPDVTQTFAIAVGSSFQPDLMPVGWTAEVAVSKFNVTSGNETIYKPDYAKANWSGNLFAFPVSSAGVVDYAHPRWDAAARIKAQNYTNTTWNPTGRKIVTLKSDGAKIPFAWNSLDPTQQIVLGTATTGPNVLNYIRGDRTNESATGYRRRVDSVLGDIVHSRPFYVGEQFGAVSASNPRVYVAANDGMLHAFDATTGDEVFAYIPSMVIPKLINLTVDNDPFIHRYYVDGSPNVGKTDTQTILVGGLGAGGKGLYALDITDPTASTEQLAADKILWEITNVSVNNNTGDDSYTELGNTYGKPVIGKVQTGDYAAIIGNGYNGTPNSVLFVINLTTGALIQKITAGSGTGLSSPTATDTDGDGIIDYVYAGDVDGNLWKFDLTSASSSSWTATKLFSTSVVATPAKAITGAPSIRAHPVSGYMVNFGSGRMFTTAEAADTSVSYVYGIWDNGTPVTLSSKVVNQTLTEKLFNSTKRVRTSSSNTVDWTQKQGWSLQLPGGERVVGDGSFVSNGLYTFTTTNPTIVHPKLNNIDQPPGEDWLIEVRYDTGGAPATPIFDLNLSGVLESGDLVAPDGGSPPKPATAVPVARLVTYGVMSQPIEVLLASGFGKVFFNTNLNLDAPAEPEGGVSGGHFDFDIYWGCNFQWTTPKTGPPAVATGWSCAHHDHTHEYDNQYNVTGTNMLNPSDPAKNLSLAIPATSTTPFKVLLAGQRLSPGVVMKLGANATTDDWVPVYSYQTDPALTAATVLTSARTYVRSGADNTNTFPLVDMLWNMPLNTFTTRNWAGDGQACNPPNPFDPMSLCRVGLVPGVTGCVTSSENNSHVVGDPAMNGALTMQIIDANTPETDIELNVASDPAMGWRVKKTAQTRILAQYTLFWHAPNNQCYGDPGYKPNPPADFTDPGDGLPPSGSGDPHGGFNGGNNSGGVATSQYIEPYFTDDTYVVETAVRNSDGTITVHRDFTCLVNCTPAAPPPPPGDPQGKAKPLRGSWKELLRQ